MIIKCFNCGYRWNYLGIGRRYALCPRCRAYNKVFYDWKRRRWC